jgi:1,4-dihydroxy-2-naphthoate octaprenyltransferase
MISPAGKERSQVKAFAFGYAFGRFPERLLSFKPKVLKDTYNMLSRLAVASRRIHVLHIPAGRPAITVIQAGACYFGMARRILWRILFKRGGLLALFRRRAGFGPFFAGRTEEEENQKQACYQKDVLHTANVIRFLIQKRNSCFICSYICPKYSKRIMNAPTPPPLRSWLLATRPRTLTASLSPVLLGCALAWRDEAFKTTPAILCLLVALLAQIASNFANDYFDFKKGADANRLSGPPRAVASGWIAPPRMLTAACLTLGLACLCGLGLLCYGGWLLLIVGAAMAVCVIAYSAGPYPLAYNGWGDACVLLFYGVIPVCFTYYVQAATFSLLSFTLSLGVGFLSVNILVVNNYRDYKEDKKAGKRTTIVLFGRAFGKAFYLLNGLFALLAALPAVIQSAWWIQSLFAAFSILFLSTWRELHRSRGKALNQTLAHTARNVLLYTLLLAVWLLR